MADEYEIICATGYIGGAKGDLDNIATAEIAAAVTRGLVATADWLSPYKITDSGTAENSPWVIQPDDEVGNKRWEMIGMLATGFEASVASGDPKFVWDIGGVDKFVAGVDDDDSDKWKLCVGSAVGTNTAIEVDASKNVNIAAHDGATVGLELGGTLVTASAAEFNELDGISSNGGSLIRAANYAAQLALLSGQTATQIFVIASIWGTL